MLRFRIRASIFAVTLCCLASAQASSIYQQVQVNSPFSATYVIDSGTAPFTWSVTGGQIPPGLQLNASTGTLSGTFTTAGFYLVQLTATDSSSPQQSTSQLIGFSVAGQSTPPPPPNSGPPTIDVVISADSPNGTSITTPSFSTASANELLLAFIATDGQTANTTVGSVSGCGVGWTLVLRTNAQAGTAEIWRAFVPNGVANCSVTAHLPASHAASMTVMTFAGVDTSGTNGSGSIGAVAGSNGASGIPSATLTTTRANSWIIGVGNDWDNAIPRTLPPGQTLVHQDLAPVGDTYWVQRFTNPANKGGVSVMLSDVGPSGDRYNLSVVEVRGPQGSTSAPSVAISSPSAGQTISGSVPLVASVPDNVTGATVQFTIDGVNTGPALSKSPFSYSWDTTSVANGAHTISARLADDQGNTATASPVPVTVSNSAPAPPSTSLLVSPTTMNFGNVNIGSSSTQQGTLTAKGGSVTVTTANVSGSGFSVSGVTYPLTLATGQSATFNVTFSPGAGGQANGTVAFSSNATGGSLAQVTLTGAGVTPPPPPPPSHGVDLSWTGSTSTVSGYNIYRAGQTGGPYTKINSSVISTTTFSDANVQAGATYFYVLTAVANAQESAFSNEALAAVPTP